MKKIYYLLFMLLPAFTAHAQFEQVSVGAGYANMAFYDIKTGATTQHPHTVWDIAFAVGPQDLGVFVNEGVASSPDAVEVALYVTTAASFEEADTSGMTRIYNNEISWSAGAFNHVKSNADPFDFGWGTYDVITHQVQGSRIFVIKLRSGPYKKLEIQSLAGGVYTFRYADLDGSNETTQTVDKADFAGKTLAYFSFETESVLDLEPESWDLLFTRYTTPLESEGVFLEYIVTGTLSNKGVEVAQADGIDPATVDFENYSDSYSDTLTTIGHDWKAFDLSSFQWSIPTDRVYFVKNAVGEIWKVQFVDFEGSSTGTTTIEQSLVGTVTNLDNIFQHLESFGLYPNPATDFVNIALESKTSAPQALIQIFNTAGQLLRTQQIAIQAGLNTEQLSLNLPAGIYQVSVQVGTDRITKPLIVK